MAESPLPLMMLVEDNPADVTLTIETLDSMPAVVELVVARDGVEAMNYVNSTANRRPDLILLDLNLPRKDGREVLKELKSDPAHSDIPIIIHSTSNSPGDVRHAYRLHANSFIQKASLLEEFGDTLSSILEYWLNTVTLPPAQKKSDPAQLPPIPDTEH